jgi:hypothetical protein
MNLRNAGGGERRTSRRRFGTGRRVTADRRLLRLDSKEQTQVRALLKACGFRVPPSAYDPRMTGERRSSEVRRVDVRRRHLGDRRAT